MRIKDKEVSILDSAELAAMDSLCRVDTLLWAQFKRIKVKSGLSYDMSGHPYQCGFLRKRKRITHIKKGTQIGGTLVLQLSAIHGLIYKRYPLGVIYMMPSEKIVERFSKLRFTPMFDDNSWLKRYLTVNNVNEKVINSGTLMFVGARSQSVGGTNTKDSAALRTFEADKVIRDELDLHDMDMVEQSKQRLNYSDIREEDNISTPTYPGYGIDALYNSSDQGKWQILCRSCGKYTCLEDTFPQCIQKVGDDWRRVCVSCGKEIFVVDGSWQADFPDREEEGLWASSFLSPKADLKVYMDRYYTSEGKALCEFQRSILGMASIEAESQLSKQGVFSCCGSDLPASVSSFPTCGGVDIGKILHVVVGFKTGNDSFCVLNVFRCETFEEVLGIFNRMNVKYAVVDAMPEIHKAKEFQIEARKSGCMVYRCQYSEQSLTRPSYDNKTGIVKCNRNELCDSVHETFSDKKVVIPKRTPEIEEFAAELSSTAKQIVEHPDTGIPRPRWIKLGADHYFHAFLYFKLASRFSKVRGMYHEIKAGHNPQRRINRYHL